MRKNLACAAAMIILASMTTALWADQIIYSQPPDLLTSYNTWTSLETPQGIFAQTFDDFSLATAQRINGVTWRGNYIDIDNPAGNPATANTISFNINFYEDDSGQPGTLLQSNNVPLNDIIVSFVGNTDFSLNGSDVPIPVFDYEANLPTEFNAAANEIYWMSVISNSSVTNPLWSWFSGNGGNDKSVQELSNTKLERPRDRSFSLLLIPEPTTLSVLAIVGLALLRCRVA